MRRRNRSLQPTGDRLFALYDRLLRIQPSPIVQLNRAVAVAMCDGPEAGLTLIDAVLEQGELANYYLLHSARADMYAGSAGQLRLRPLMRKLWR